MNSDLNNNKSNNFNYDNRYKMDNIEEEVNNNNNILKNFI